MTVFRDWPRTLRPASFRGVPFYVERDQVETGRRLVVHEFPLKDAPYIEDLGRDTNKISVTAYLVGDTSDDAEKSLRSACEQRGSGSLSLPIDRFEVHCESCSRDFAKDKLGFIAFNLKFVRDGTGTIAMPAGFLAAQIGFAALDAVRAVGLWLPAVLGGLSSIGIVREQAAGEVRAAAATITATARTATLDPALGAAALSSAADVARLAESLIRVGDTPHAVTLTSFAEARPGETGDLTGQLRATLDTLRLAVDPETGARLLAELAAYEVPSASVTPRVRSRRDARRAAEAVATALRILALAGYAEALAARTYGDRRAAIQARADAGELFAAEADRIVPGPGMADLHRSLLTVSARLTEFLTRRVADLAPVMIVEAPLAMPSLWWANRLYTTQNGTPPRRAALPKDIEARAADLVARNRVIHASFMPERLEAIADAQY